MLGIHLVRRAGIETGLPEGGDEPSLRLGVEEGEEERNGEGLGPGVPRRRYDALDLVVGQRDYLPPLGIQPLAHRDHVAASDDVGRAVGLE